VEHRVPREARRGRHEVAAVERDEGRRRGASPPAGGERQRRGDGSGDLPRGEAEEAEPRGGAVVREAVAGGHAEGEQLAEVGRELDAGERGLR
jgi:hypothetical protein